MRNLLIADVETGGLNPSSDPLIEVAAAVWNVDTRTVIRSRSWLVAGTSNPAIAVNGIPEAILSAGIEREQVMRHVHNVAVKECFAIVSHNITFDREWFTPEIQRLEWICSCDDIQWPRPSTSRSLTALALAHGVGVVSAHRALDDVMTLCRLFERAAEVGDLEEMLKQAMRPRGRFQALVSFDRKDEAKERGFRWDGEKKTWERRMALDDTKDLPFAVRQVA